MSNNFTCHKCGAKFPNNNKLTRHLDRKISCDKGKTIASICKYCNEIFTNQYNCKRHENERCMFNMEALIHRQKNDVSSSILQSIFDKEKEIKQNVATEKETTSSTKSEPNETSSTKPVIINETPIQTTNIQHQMNIHEQHAEQLNNIQEQHNHNNTIHLQQQIHFYVLPYTDENTKHITDEYLLKLYDETRMRNAIPKMIKDIHLNPEHPENMNFLLHKNTMEYKSEKDTWEEVNTDMAIKDLITHKEIKLDDFYQKNKLHLKKDQIKNYKDLKSNLDRNDDYKKYLKKTILEYFIQSKDFMEHVVKLDQFKTTNHKKIISAMKSYQTAVFAMTKIMEADLSREPKEIDNEAILQYIQTMLE
jgi:Zinc finger, C2H2 type